MNRIHLLVIIFFVGVVSFFFKDVLFWGKLPVPADTIVGLYHPFRDFYSSDHPRGIPFKNFLITDPVRQQYPWREVAITIIKKGELPLWNPYSMGGYPLLGNLQSGVFYPLNALFFLLPFSMGWSVLIVLEIILMSLFMYLYLTNVKLNPWASVLGSLTFSFSGFSVAWLEWGTILHVALWLPLLLLSIDRIVIPGTKDKGNLYFVPVFMFALCASFFAGHLQTFFYLFIFVCLYFLVRWFKQGRNLNTLSLFLALVSVGFVITAVQWIPTVQLILESAREVDQIDWQKTGWFIPRQHLIQFVAPDFFGNPTTLNYWGVWNYGEFIGYIGIAPLIFALFAIFFRRDRRTMFFGTFFFLSLIFSLPTLFAKLPYILQIPFISTAQPTRLLFITDFSLAILAAFGLDYFIKTKQKKSILSIFVILTILFCGLWAFALSGKEMGLTSTENLLIVKNNLKLPTLLFTSLIILVLLSIYFSKSKRFTIMIYIIIVAITAFDLLRFGWKFTPFTQKEYLFPKTKTIEFLQKNTGIYRIMSVDDRILPPNFSTYYRLQSVDGYDPLYLQRYGELIAASERGKPDISPPFGFNRIITPENYNSRIIDLLGVKYILSLSDISSPKLKKVFQEGQTRVYENKDVLPRVFFVKRAELKSEKEDILKSMFSEDVDLRNHAFFERHEQMQGVNSPFVINDLSEGTAEIIEYSENRIRIRTHLPSPIANQANEGLLILTDTYYPTWKVKIYKEESKSNSSYYPVILKTDYNFRGVIVPGGTNIVEFYNMWIYY